LLAIVPAVIVVLIYGDAGLNRLLILSQVILSCQLPFAIIPLVIFTSQTKYMGGHPRLPFRDWVHATILHWKHQFVRLWKKLRGMMTLKWINMDDNREEQEVPLVMGWTMFILSILTSTLVTGLNIYLVLSAIFG
jgi:Mn2+/Fe2+ NRAMP family transporter